MRRESFNSILLGICACAVGLMWSSDCVSQEGGDLQAQILYAFQTGDSHRLQDIRQSLDEGAKDATPTAALRYHLAHADYRLAKLTGMSERDSAQRALQDCVEQLDALLSVDKASVEALTLQSACYAALADYKRLQAPLLRSRAADRISKAQRLAPGNPRVKLVLAQSRLEQTPSPASIPHELVEAAESFEHSAATGNDTPGWGHAETYLLMGHELRLRGDVVGARNWIEKALIAAPDFKAAQQELAQVAH